MGPARVGVPPPAGSWRPCAPCAHPGLCTRGWDCAGVFSGGVTPLCRASVSPRAGAPGRVFGLEGAPGGDPGALLLPRKSQHNQQGFCSPAALCGGGGWWEARAAFLGCFAQQSGVKIPLLRARREPGAAAAALGAARPRRPRREPAAKLLPGHAWPGKGGVRTINGPGRFPSSWQLLVPRAQGQRGFWGSPRRGTEGDRRWRCRLQPRDTQPGQPQ